MPRDYADTITGRASLGAAAAGDDMTPHSHLHKFINTLKTHVTLKWDFVTWDRRVYTPIYHAPRILI